MGKMDVFQKSVDNLRTAIPELRGVLVASSEGLPIAYSLSNGADANRATLNPGLYVVAPYVRVTTPVLNANCGSTGFPNVAAAVMFSCDSRTLTYSMSIGTGSSGRDTIWNSTYPSPLRVITLRTRSR